MGQTVVTGCTDLRTAYPTIQVVNNENHQYKSEGNSHNRVNPIQEGMVLSPNISAALSLKFSCRGIISNNPNDQKCDKVLHPAAIVLPLECSVRSLGADPLPTDLPLPQGKK